MKSAYLFVLSFVLTVPLHAGSNCDALDGKKFPPGSHLEGQDVGEYCRDMEKMGIPSSPAGAPVDPDGLPSFPGSVYDKQKENAARRKAEEAEIQKNGGMPGEREQAVFAAAKHLAIEIGRRAGRSASLSAGTKRILSRLVSADYHLVSDRTGLCAERNAGGGPDVEGFASGNGIYICAWAARDLYQREGVSQAAVRGVIGTMIHESGHVNDYSQDHGRPARMDGYWAFEKELSSKHRGWIYGDFGDSRSARR